MMYGFSDFLVAEAIIHTIGRKQAEEEAQQAAQPMPKPSLLSWLAQRLTAQPAYDSTVGRLPESDPSLACE